MSLVFRRKLFVVLVVTIFVLLFAIGITLAVSAPLNVGVIVGAVVGFSIGAIEEFYVQGRAGVWLRRMRPILAVPVYALVLCVLFIAVQHLAFAVTGRIAELSAAYGRYSISIPALFIASSMAILGLRVVGFIGSRNLLNLLIGRYMRPIIERKVLLFLDMKGSTAVVEELGPIRAKSYIGRFMFDISRPVTEHGGEVYLYTGDGLIGMWDWDTAIAHDAIIAAVDGIYASIERQREGYERDFNRYPRFRIGIHGGDVVISEQGDTKRSIGVYGDAINIAARMEQKAKEIDAECILSADVAAALSGNIRGVEPRGEVSVRGISEPIGIASYTVLSSK